MPKPPMMRARTNSVGVRGMAAPTAEMPKKMAERMSIFLRPNLSLSMPASNAPSAQPISTQLATQPSCVALSWNWAFMNPMAPEMTAVSKPKSRPPTAATMLIR